MVEALKPEYVAPLIAYLCHESCQETGSIFECGSGWVSKVRWQRTGGVGFPINKPLLPEHIAAKWNVICDFDDGRATHPTSTQESFAGVQENFDNVSKDQPAAASSVKSAESAKSAKLPVAKFSYTEKEVILYALGVGSKKTDLPLVYENSDSFVTLPTFAVIPAFDYQFNAVTLTDYLPEFNPMMLVHGEQYTEIHKPFPTKGTVTNEGRFVDIIDKGKGTVCVLGVTTKDEKGEVVAYNEFSNFIRGLSGYGTKTPTDRGAATADYKVPNRPADKIVKEKISEDLAALYRLSGDWNPLHIDPSMSAMGGFDVPILHGLCTYGIAGKHIFKAYGDFKSIKVRFTKHVFPGETIETHMWKEGDTIIFTVKVLERDVIAIASAAAILRGAPSKAKAATGASLDVPGFGASKIFVGIDKGLKAMKSEQRIKEVQKVKAIFAFNVTNKDKKVQNWYVDMKVFFKLIRMAKVQLLLVKLKQA